jgi:16S rRNA (uracil1498-N3)-methyltransferase
MNLLLLEPSELRDDGTAQLTGRRADHVREVLRAAPGERLRVGRVDGPMGVAEVLAIEDAGVLLREALDAEAPPPSAVALLLAVPRPKILRKVLQAAAAMGVKRLVLLGSYRVEKSYFGSPLLAPDALRAELLLGLEQGRDTRVPEVTVHRFFKPFVEDELDVAFGDAVRLLAHPAAAAPLEAAPPTAARAVIAIGPEGGWTAYEAGALEAHGFRPYALGPRPLRVDQAVPYAVGQAELWLRQANSATTGPS